MKLIQDGIKWWIGKVGKCETCGANSEFEQDDGFVSNVDGSGIMHGCPYCSGGFVYVFKDALVNEALRKSDTDYFRKLESLRQ